MAQMIDSTGKVVSKPFVFNSVPVGSETLSDDVFFNVGSEKNRIVSSRKVKQKEIEDAIERNDLQKLREISNLYFKKSGIYSRLCRYMAFLYKYDWIVMPVIYSENMDKKRIIDKWYKLNSIFEKSNFKKVFGRIALKVIKNGCYYGYVVKQNNAVFIQELPVDYCRCRYELNGKPAVEFNVKYFDDCFTDSVYRNKIINLFPPEFKTAYIEYRKGTIECDYPSDEIGWFLPDVSKTIKFNLSDDDCPFFVSVIPHIIDLEDAQDIDKKKQIQQLTKLLIQKIPRNKNDELLFDVETEVPAIHSASVRMLSNTVGINVLTSPLDISVEDMTDNSNVSSVDYLDRMERTVFNESGVSQDQFNSSGNVALEKSIANDSATMLDLIVQFQSFMNMVIDMYSKSKRSVEYIASILPTTIYNYKDLSETYKNQTQVGFSKLLPQVALGMSPTMIISSAVFENEVLHLNDLFIAPQMSSTISSNQSRNGRPELDDDKKTDKTMANRASMN